MASRHSEVRADLVASVLTVSVAPGEQVAPGDQVALLESMKMEIPVVSEVAASVAEVRVCVGDVVQEGDVLVVLSMDD
jgi:acetyl-CoA carboxylase biotin carboxyl carrier protein